MRVLIWLTLLLSPQFTWALPSTSQSAALHSPSIQDNCVTTFLASTGNFWSSFLSENAQAHLTPDALAYLRFLWAGYENKFIDLAQLQKVSVSKQPTNPFREASEKSFEAGLQRAIAEKIANLTTQDWSAIQIELQKILPRLESETQDRDEAQKDSSWVIGLVDPQVIELGEWARPPPAWFEFNGRIFLAAVGSKGVTIFELDLTTGRLLAKDFHEGTDKTFFQPSWYAHDNHLYLVSGLSGAGVQIFEYDLDIDRLILRDRKLAGPHFSSPAWYEFKGRVYLAATTGKERLHLFELVSGHLNVVGLGHYIVVGLSGSIPPVWKEHDNRLFLATSTTGVGYFGHIHVFELVADELVNIEIATVIGGIRSNAPPSWYVDNGRLLLAVSSSTNLYVFEMNLETNIITEKSHYEVGGLVQSGPSWSNYGGRLFLAVGSNNDRVYVFEWLDGHLVKLASYKTEHWIFSSPRWHEYQGRLYLAVGSCDKSLYLFEFISLTNSLLKLGQWQTEGVCETAPVWYETDGQLFLAVTSADGRLYHFNVRRKIEGRSR